jgi:hypothetical protein
MSATVVMFTGTPPPSYLGGRLTWLTWIGSRPLRNELRVGEQNLYLVCVVPRYILQRGENLRYCNEAQPAAPLSTARG